MTTAEVAREFYRRFHEDRRAGAIRSLEEYQALWPGFEEEVAKEHRRVEDLAGSRGLGVGSYEQLGPYKLSEELGRGGQAVVYQAEDTRLGRMVALKILSDLGPGSEKTVRRFRREAEVAAKLAHPGICGILDAGVIDGTPFIAMRLVEGETLAKRVSTAQAQEKSEIPTNLSLDLPLEAEEASDADSEEASDSTGGPGPSGRAGILRIVKLVEQVARALHVAHEAGVIHRDIKPGNIMVEKSGAPVLLDFGLARSEDMDLQTLTRTGDFFGTPVYMSPEQISASRIRLDRRTDIYSLGVTLFECLTCRRPFEAPSRDALYQAIQYKDAPDATRLNPWISEDLRTVLEKSLEKDRDRRYETAHDFAEELRRVREFEPIHARPITRWIKLKRWAQRNPMVAASLIFALLSLSGGLVASVISLQRAQNERDGKDEALGREQLERTRAETEQANVLRLSAFQTLADLRKRAEQDLWPLGPKKIPLYEEWLKDAKRLVAGLVAPGHYEQLRKIRERALPHTTVERETEASEERTYNFALAEDRWWHAQLLKLTTSLEIFQDEKTGLMGEGVNARIGWGVRRRLAHLRLARERLSQDRESWKASVARVCANPVYKGLQVTPQFGLVPLGRDHASGLEEYGDLATGEIAKRDPQSGKLVLTEKTGLVLVLIPEGSFWIGAQGKDPAGQNYDPDGLSDERNVHELTLSAFFLSKYEMTQGQWERSAGRNPSSYDRGAVVAGKRVPLLHPVEQVSWSDCNRELSRLGLSLPTEAQWEYGCRAGMKTPWWTGQEREALLGAANIADYSAALRDVAWASLRDWPGTDVTFKDGHVSHAPVGSFRANGFGLHDVHGNVWEWCRDWYMDYRFPARPVDGLRIGRPARFRVNRGGSFDNAARPARSGNRDADTPESRSSNIGVRPARVILMY